MLAQAEPVDDAATFLVDLFMNRRRSFNRLPGRLMRPSIPGSLLRIHPCLDQLAELFWLPGAGSRPGLDASPSRRANPRPYDGSAPPCPCRRCARGSLICSQISPSDLPPRPSRSAPDAIADGPGCRPDRSSPARGRSRSACRPRRSRRRRARRAAGAAACRRPAADGLPAGWQFTQRACVKHLAGLVEQRQRALLVGRDGGERLRT